MQEKITRKYKLKINNYLRTNSNIFVKWSSYVDERQHERTFNELCSLFDLYHNKFSQSTDNKSNN